MPLSSEPEQIRAGNRDVFDAGLIEERQDHRYASARSRDEAGGTAGKVEAAGAGGVAGALIRGMGG